LRDQWFESCPSSGESAADLSFCRVESLSSLFSRISGRDRRAPSRSVLGVADSSPRTSQRKAGSDIAPLLQPRPKSSTEQQGRGIRIPLGYQIGASGWSAPNAATERAI